MNYAKQESGLLVPAHKLLVGGRFIGQHIRNGKVIDEFEDMNLVVNEGLNALLNIMLVNATQIPSWFLGIFEGNYTPIATVTAATIVAASTESTAYTSATRPAFTPASSTAQSTDNSASQASYTFNATKTIYGAFLISNATLLSGTGTLFSAARFATAKNVVATDQLLLTYAFGASSS